MATDNALYNSLEQTYYKIKEYLERIPLEVEHATLITKLDALADLLESSEFQEIQKQTHLHHQFNAIKKISSIIVQDLKAGFDSITTAQKVERGLDNIFIEVKSIIL